MNNLFECYGEVIDMNKVHTIHVWGDCQCGCSIGFYDKDGKLLAGDDKDDGASAWSDDEDSTQMQLNRIEDDND